jgi:hypothetical protein
MLLYWLENFEYLTSTISGKLASFLFLFFFILRRLVQDIRSMVLQYLLKRIGSNWKTFIIGFMQ